MPQSMVVQFLLIAQHMEVANQVFAFALDREELGGISSLILFALYASAYPL